MFSRKPEPPAVCGWLLIALLWTPISVRAQTVSQPASADPSRPARSVARWIIMRDAPSAELLKARLQEAMQLNGLFRDPAAPISVLTNGNYLLVVGNKDAVDAHIDAIRTLAFLFERPRAHLLLNVRVVQISGSTSASVVQTSETVRALIEEQRKEVVRTFANLQQYLTHRFDHLQRGGTATIARADQGTQQIPPLLEMGARPLSVPAILLLLTLDHASGAPTAGDGRDSVPTRLDTVLASLPQTVKAASRGPASGDTGTARKIQGELTDWKTAVRNARDWCRRYAVEVKRGHEGIRILREALEQPQSALPEWLARELQRSLDLTERLYPGLLQAHAEQSLRELEHRFTLSLQRADAIEQTMARSTRTTLTKAGRSAPAELQRQDLPALQTLADELAPRPRALLTAVTTAEDNSSTRPEQLVAMLREYVGERRKLDDPTRRQNDAPGTAVDFVKLQELEGSLNLWLRRASEAMGQSIEEQFYRRYTGHLRLLAEKQLGGLSSRDLLSRANLDQVSDLVRDVLLAGTSAQIFVSNSISLQFAAETTNQVSAQVQSSLPSRQGVQERLRAAQDVQNSLRQLGPIPGLNPDAIVQAMLAGGQAVPVQAGMQLSAKPSINFDASTFSLVLSVSQTLEPDSNKVVDRVVNHRIDNATITALSYEPLVLSTLASNISYYETKGGIPILRKIPLVKNVLGDIPLAPFKEGMRQKGVYQSSIIILEPVVIPTIEDLYRSGAALCEGVVAAWTGSNAGRKTGGEEAPAMLPK